jgi:hypothetical protein
MKKLLFTCCLLLLTSLAFAQKKMPELKEGTLINSVVLIEGQEIPLQIFIKKLNNPFTLTWEVSGFGSGSFEMSDKALESATKMFVTTQPDLGVTKLQDDETFLLISKKAFQAFVNEKEFIYSGLKFKQSTNPKSIKIGGQEIDAFHVVSNQGNIELWVLNNPNFPLILQSTGLDADIVMQEIK